MSHHIVMPIRPAAQEAGDGSMEISDRIARACAKKYWHDKGQAGEYAKELAKKHPQVQFAVFSPSVIYETLPPPPPPPVELKMLKKRVTDTGEIVIDKEEE